jgi:hypothetical protein
MLFSLFKHNTYMAGASGFAGNWYSSIMGLSSGIGPGSGRHWSDGFRNEFGNFMLMSSTRFTGIYGHEKYNSHIANYASDKAGYWTIRIPGLGQLLDPKGLTSWGVMSRSRTLRIRNAWVLERNSGMNLLASLGGGGLEDYNYHSKPLIPANALAPDALNQFALSLRYVNQFGRLKDIRAGDLFNHSSMMAATKTLSRERGVRTGQIGNIKYYYNPDPNVIADDVRFVTATKGRTESINNPRINESWFGSTPHAQQFGLQLKGSLSRGYTNILTLYFDNYQQLMLWVDFVKQPWE